MKSLSPKPRLSATHLFSGVAIDCSIVGIVAPNAAVCAIVRFILDETEPKTDAASDEQKHVRRKPPSDIEFIVSVAADSMKPSDYVISCRGRLDHDRHQLDRCYREALRAADEAGARIAMIPVPSTGGTPEERVRTAERTARQISSTFEHLRSIRFRADDERTFRAFRQRLAKQSGRSKGSSGDAGSAGNRVSV